MTERAFGLTSAARKHLRRQRRWLRRLGVASLMAVFAIGAWGFEETATPTGLKGIWPADVPASLAAEQFTGIAASWETWGQGASEAVGKFYKMEGDVAAQREQLAVLKSKRNVLKKAVGDSKYSAVRESLLSLHGALSRRIDLAEAVLDTLEFKGEGVRTKRLKERSSGVSSALSSLESYLRGVPGGSAWMPFIKGSELRSALSSGADSEAAIAAAAVTKNKLARRETLTDANQKEFLGKSNFRTLEAALDRYLAATQIPAANTDPTELRKQLAVVAAAADEYESASNLAAGAQLRSAVKLLETLSSDGGDRIAALVEKTYLNDNLRVVASESLVNKLLSDSRTEQGQVRDFILGANVGGSQTTTTNVNVNLLPASDRVRFELQLSGNVQSNTAGATPDATIYTQGNHTFNARKEVSFDGLRFATTQGTIAVNPSNRTTGATTRFAGLPIIGRIAQRTALEEAGKRRPQSEAIAAGRIQDRVLPAFNSEVDRAFSDVGGRLDQQLFAGLRATDLFPGRYRYESTDSVARVGTRLMAEGELGGSVPEAILAPEDRGATTLMHETLVNNTIDRLDLAGKTMSEEELRVHIEAFLTKALSRSFKFRSPAQASKPAQPTAVDAEEDEETKIPAKLVFAKEDPIRVQFRNGQMLLVIRAGLEREGKDPIPAQEITVPINVEVKNDQLIVTPDQLQLAGIDGDLSPIERKVINTKISQALPARTTSAKFDIKAPKRTVQMRINRVLFADGWASIGMQ